MITKYIAYSKPILLVSCCYIKQSIPLTHFTQSSKLGTVTKGFMPGWLTDSY